MSGTIDREITEKLGSLGRQAGKLCLDLLLPRRCPICEKISDGICEDCARKLPYVCQPFCYRCGKPLQDAAEEYCAACRNRKHFFTQGRALYHYAEPVRESLHAVKYRNKREYLEYFAQDMGKRLGDVIRGWDPQVFIPIPMHPAAKRKRGYNQAEILAKLLGRQMEIPVCCDVLKKIRKTADQKELGYRERHGNLKGAFAVNPRYLEEAAPTGCLPWKRVLLVDDIFTTGSTIQEAAKILRAAGAEQVYFVTLCIVSEDI